MSGRICEAPPPLAVLPRSPHCAYSLINWVFSLPAFFTIDTFGRRSLLLFTLPFLSLFMFIAGSGFWISDQKGQLGMVVTGVYLFAAFYGPGLGSYRSARSKVCTAKLTRPLQDRYRSPIRPSATRSKSASSVWVLLPPSLGSGTP